MNEVLGESVRKHWAIIGGALILGTSLLASPGDATAGAVEDAIAAARKDVEQGRCEQAYSRLASINGLESRARLLAGQCRIRAGLYPEALSELDRARGSAALSSEQVGDLELYRAVALYHLERYAEATAALDGATGLTVEHAQLALYRGLLALRAGDNERAAPALESAARLSPQLTEPVASYYAGLAWQGVSERNKARAAFERVIALDPDGPWGQEAKKLLDSTQLFPYYARGSVGFEFDDNALLRGDVTQTNNSGEILDRAGEEDGRGVWQVEGGIQLFSAGDLSGGLNAGYSGDAHFDLKEINTHYPTIGAYLAHRFGANTLGQARYRFGYAWVNEDPYLLTHTGELSLGHTWDKVGTTLVSLDATSNDLRFRPDEVADGTGNPGDSCGGAVTDPACGPPGVNERRERKRDGYEIGAGLEHSALLPVPSAIEGFFEQVQIAGGYRFSYYDSRGEEWQHFGHRFSAALDVELPIDFSVSSRVSYTHRDFANPSTFADAETDNVQYALSSSDRSEDEFVVLAEIEKDLTKNLSTSARYSFLNNSSNRNVYRYDRHIVGGYLNFRFD